jgi:hypothetical protein
MEAQSTNRFALIADLEQDHNMVDTPQKTSVSKPLSQRPRLKSHIRVAKKKKTSRSSSPSVLDDTEVFEDAEKREDKSINLSNEEKEEVQILQTTGPKKDAVPPQQALGTALDLNITTSASKTSFPLSVPIMDGSPERYFFQAVVVETAAEHAAALREKKSIPLAIPYEFNNDISM